jgi:sarcosine oxidase subunit beta
MQRFSAFALAKRAFSGQTGWERQWRAPEPQAEYDVLIIGGGGHGLATAYYLAKEHGIRRIAVLEKGWIGGGNTGRNTTIIRSNYLFDESAALYDHSLKLWESLSQELNYNVMFSQRGVMMLAHTVHDEQVFKRHVHANRLNGVDNEWLDAEQAKAFCPPLNLGPGMRYPVLAPPCSAAPAPRGMMPWPGVTPAPRMRWAWTSCRTAPSPRSTATRPAR